MVLLQGCSMWKARVKIDQGQQEYKTGMLQWVAVGGLGQSITCMRLWLLWLLNRRHHMRAAFRETV